VEFKIEKGIPVPERCSGEWARLITAMKPGDSVVVPRGKDQAIRSAAKIHGAIITLRAIDASKMRVWLVSRAPKQ
jgi:hypothetical protein